MSNTKKCGSCGKIRSYSEFYKRSNRAGGVGSKCVSCYKKYRKENKSHIKNYSQSYREEKSWMTKTKNMVYHAKVRAKQTGLPFNIDIKYVREIFPEDGTHECPYCEQKMCVEYGYKLSSASPTLDKIIPSLGYVKGNVTVACRRCNTFKNDAASSDEMKKSLPMKEVIGNIVVIMEEVEKTSSIIMHDTNR